MLKFNFNLIFTVVNVLVLFAAVRIFLWKPVHKILDERKAMVDKDFADAAQARSEAEALAAERQALLANMDQEREAMVADATRAAQVESAEIISEAKSRAESIIQNAQVQAQSEKEAILRSAQSEITDIIVAATAKMVGIQANTSNDSDLYDAFLKKAGDEE